MKRIVVATKNPGKIREMTAAFRELPVELVTLASFGRLPDAVEDGATFAANAEIKARFYMQATGVACLADDSGLESSRRASRVIMLTTRRITPSFSMN